MPDRCPVCSAGVAREADEAVTRCTNMACPAQRFERILHFASRGAMDIEGLGDVTISHLLERQMIGDVADIFSLEPASLLELPGFKDRSVENLMRAIEVSEEQASLAPGFRPGHKARGKPCCETARPAGIPRCKALPGRPRRS